jgi:hypothetical protein
VCSVDPKFNERVSALETGVLNLRADMLKVEAAVKEGFREIATAVGANSRTNWSTILAALLVLLALYGATVRPITADVARQEASAAVQATAVLEQNKQIVGLQVQLAAYVRDLQRLEKDVGDLEKNGSPVMDKRLSLIEARVERPVLPRGR